MTEPSEYVVARGAWGTVVVVREALRYLDGIGAQAQAQFDSRVEVLAENGTIKNETQFRTLKAPGRPPVAELKLHPGPGYRFYCVRSGACWVVTHGDVKPRSNAAYGREVKRARRIFEARGSQ